MSAEAAAWGAVGDHSPIMNNYGSPPRVFVKGEGAYLWDADGEQYLDYLCGLAVTALGHCHPAVSSAIADQAQKLIHTSNLFANEHQAKVAQLINDLIDSGSGQVLFQNSGAEANEAAIKLARKAQGDARFAVISTIGSFHGRTLATLAATGQPSKHAPFAPMPDGFRHVDWEDLDQLEAAMAPDIAAVLIESVQGEGGVRPADPEYLRGVAAICARNDVLLIMDEIQSGMGRTGRWFGFQHAGITPDIVTMAKAMANGVPTGAMWARDDIACSFGPGDHGSTFAGQALVMAAALATIQTYVEMDAPAVVQEKGATLKALLEEIEGVDHVRGLGLLLAVEITPDALDGRTGADLAKACLEEHLVVNGVTKTALRIAPPYVTTLEQMKEATSILSRVIGAKST